MRLSPRTRLGPYEVLSAIGAGGMGEVYRAWDTRLEREVALKILSERVASRPRALARLEREARAVAALSHPGILAVYDLSIDGPFPFAVMELLDGEDLSARLLRGPIPWPEAVGIGIALAEALAAAHSKGVLHRDLKPSNVFLTRDGRVKLLDFGLAHRAPSSESPVPERAVEPTLTEPGATPGTVAYMPPEVLRGLPATERGDIYSLGCVLFEMVAGHRPFAAQSPPDVAASVLRDPAPALSGGSPPIPSGLARLVARCLVKDPERRFHSAQDLAFALQTLSSGAVARSSRSSRSSRPAGPEGAAGPRVRPPVVFLSVGLALLIAAGMAWNGSRRTIREPATHAIAVLPLTNLSGDPAQDYFADGMTDDLITSLARSGSLRVTSRTSVMGFKGTRERLPELARKLGVDTLVEGSVRRTGTRVRVVAQLVDGATDKTLWSETFERDERDLLSLQTELARAIAERVGAALEPARGGGSGSGPVNPRAYDAYLKGRFCWFHGGEAEKDAAQRHLEEAIALDPSFSRPYAQLAAHYLFLGSVGSLPPKDAREKLAFHVGKALEIDDRLPQARAMNAGLHLYFRWDPETAEREIRRVEVDEPWDGTAKIHAQIHQAKGRLDLAVDVFRENLRKDPLSLATGSGLASALSWAGRHEEAAVQIRQVLEFHADSALSHELLADALEALGQLGPAIESTRTALSVAGFDDWAEELVADYREAGYRESMRRLARKRLDELEAVAGEGVYVAPLKRALLHGQLGERDAAFSWLERAFEERSPWLIFIRVDPAFDPLRDDPRFPGFVARVVPGP